MTEPNAKTAEESQEEQQQENLDGQTPQEKQEERLFAGRFKTPEELEEGYRHSSQEGVRLAQEVKRLQNELQQAKTPKEAEKIQDKIDDLTQYFDENTAKVLDTWGERKFRKIVKEEITNFQSQSQAQSEFTKQVTEEWEATKKLYPEVADTNSKLYKRANEILFERNLAQQDASGRVVLLTPFAYRIAVEAADAELSRQEPANADLKTKKEKAGAVQGRTSGVTTQGKLTYEQYSKLSDEAKDSYDQQQRNK